MTDPAAQTTPAGWYADATTPGQQRWWDGVAWTDHVAPAPAPAGMVPKRPDLPADRPIYSVFIWLIVLLPLVTYGLLFTWYPTIDYSALSSPSDLRSNPLAIYGSFFGPGYFLIMGSSLLIYALSVFFAYRDVVWLRRQGVERPFAWPFAFFGGLVYVIGRSVIVRSVARPRGLTPIWIMIGVIVVGIVLSSIWSIMLSATMFQQIQQQFPSSGS